MLKDEINGMIMDSMKNRTEVRTKVLRLLKAELVKASTLKSAVWDEEMENKILNRMKKQYEDSIEQYRKAGREDLVAEEEKEFEVLSTFLPKPVTEKEIRTTLGLLSIPHEKPFMGQLIREVKRLCPTADGALVSKIVLDSINNK